MSTAVAEPTPPPNPQSEVVADGISPTERDTLFAPLLKHRRALLAVSGGLDSMALLSLAARWRAERKENSAAQCPDLHVATVDHGLRAAAGDEAAHVGRFAAGFGIAHTVLTLDQTLPSEGLQAAAREARYAALAAHADALGATAIVTAHTEDDQAETVLMRLLRGSGIDGLAGMRAGRELGSVLLLRPLLGVSRARLRATLVACATAWCDDPSNDDRRFERVRVRQAMGDLERLGLTRTALARLARRANRARDALDGAASVVIAKDPELLARYERFGDVILPRDDIAGHATEVALRVLIRVLDAVGGGRTVELEKYEDCLDAILGHSSSGVTLAGCEVRSDAECITIIREVGRMGDRAGVLGPGGSIIWDGRCRIDADQPAPDADTRDEPVSVKRMDDATIEQFRSAGAALPEMNRRVLASQPVVALASGALVAPTLTCAIDQGGRLIPGHEFGLRARYIGLSPSEWRGGGSFARVAETPRSH